MQSTPIRRVTRLIRPGFNYAGVPVLVYIHSTQIELKTINIAPELIGREITFLEGGSGARAATLKILQISSAQSLGGGERHLADLTNGLTARGHEVQVALRPASPLIAELNIGGAKGPASAKVTTLPLRNSFDAMSARALSKLVRREQIQIVHAHMARDYPLAAFAVRGNSGARLIVTRHVLFSMNRLHRITLAKTARIIAVSRAVAHQLGADGVARSDQISVVLNGINTLRFQNARERFDRAAFLGSWGFPDAAMLVGIVGELNPLKGQEEFLRAAAAIRAQIPHTHFIIAGTDSSRGNKNRASLEQLIRELKLTDCVRLVGWVEDLAQLYCALDVFVSASHTESFGLAIAEAMASGAAVVSTETEGAREIIRAGETGLLVPIGDVAKITESILMLLQDKALGLRLGKAAQDSVAAEFGLERMVDETEAIYLAAIESK